MALSICIRIVEISLWAIRSPPEPTPNPSLVDRDSQSIAAARPAPKYAAEAVSESGLRGNGVRACFRGLPRQQKLTAPQEKSFDGPGEPP
jgi:hypothetical protein